MAMSVSVKKDTKKTNIAHNNRMEKEVPVNVDESRSHKNKYLIQEDLEELYKREFGDALEKYNAKQVRVGKKERQIESYYDHIKASRKVAVQQEMIIQIGDKDDFIADPGREEVVNEILEEWLEDFQERNPNLKIYNAVIHNDEASPHLHINFVPVAEVAKRGLEKQVAFDRAIVQQDEQSWMEYDALQDRKSAHAKAEREREKDLKKRVPYPFEEWEDEIDRPFAKWREDEVGFLEELLNERGIERKMVGTNEFKDTNDYKEKKDLKREIEQLGIEYQEARIKTAAELERFKRAHDLNEEIKEPEQKEGEPPIIVVGAGDYREPMPEIDVQHVKKLLSEHYEVNPEQIEKRDRWTIDLENENKKLKKELKETKSESQTRNRQLLGIIDTQKKEVKQLVAVAITSERAQTREERQSDSNYISRLEDGLQDAEERAEAFEEKSEVLARWKERALAVMDQLGVRKHFESVMSKIKKSRGEDFER